MQSVKHLSTLNIHSVLSRMPLPQNVTHD